MPNFKLTDGTKAGELLTDGKGLIPDFDGEAPLRQLAGRWPDQINHVAGEAREQLGLTAVIGRPDGFVAWGTDVAPDLSEAADAATRWFGKPATTA